MRFWESIKSSYKYSTRKLNAVTIIALSTTINTYGKKYFVCDHPTLLLGTTFLPNRDLFTFNPVRILPNKITISGNKINITSGNISGITFTYTHNDNKPLLSIDKIQIRCHIQGGNGETPANNDQVIAALLTQVAEDPSTVLNTSQILTKIKDFFLNYFKDITIVVHNIHIDMDNLIISCNNLKTNKLFSSVTYFNIFSDHDIITVRNAKYLPASNHLTISTIHIDTNFDKFPICHTGKIKHSNQISESKWSLYIDQIIINSATITNIHIQNDGRDILFTMDDTILPDIMSIKQIFAKYSLTNSILWLDDIELSVIDKKMSLKWLYNLYYQYQILSGKIISTSMSGRRLSINNLAITINYNNNEIILLADEIIWRKTIIIPKIIFYYGNSSITSKILIGDKFITKSVISNENTDITVFAEYSDGVLLIRSLDLGNFLTNYNPAILNDIKRLLKSTGIKKQASTICQRISETVLTADNISFIWQSYYYNIYGLYIDIKSGILRWDTITI